MSRAGDIPWKITRALLSAAPLVILFTDLLAAEPSTPRSIETAFTSTLTKLEVKPSDSSLTAVWEYTNHWDVPLAVERFETSCGCLNGNTPQTILEPDKTGKITATFTPGQHRGILRKSLHIRFVGHEKPVELTVEAHIPSHVEISTQDIIWTAEEKNQPRTIELTSGTGQTFTVTALQGLPSDQFTLATETVTAGTHHRITITPTVTASGQHILQIHTDSPDPRDQVKAVFLHLVAGTSIPSPSPGHPVPTLQKNLPAPAP